MSATASHNGEHGDDVPKNEHGTRNSQAPKQDAGRRDNANQQRKTREETGMEAHWVALAKEFRDADEDLVKNVDDSINSLLLFAGLFSVVQSAFAVATYPLLQPSLVVSCPLIQPSAVASCSLLPPSPPKASDVTINVFVFSSLGLALICALAGILRKKQLKQHLSWTSKRVDARSQITYRQLSFERCSSRRLWDSASHISVGLTLSITLFAVGIFILLWTSHWRAALGVFLFTWFSLCVIFSRDIAYHYRQCRYWWRRFDWYDFLTGFSPISKRVEDEFGLLSRAIMSRTSILTASGLDPDVGCLVTSVLGLSKLPESTDLWRVLTPQKVAGAQLESVELERVLDIVLAILEDRDPLKGSPTFPLSLWSKVRGYITFEMPSPQQRSVSRWMGVDSLASVHPWFVWLYPALYQLNMEETCLLANIVSDQLALTLLMTDPLRGSVAGVDFMPEEPLFSAFCLACRMLDMMGRHRGPRNVIMKLRRAIALAGMRLQFSFLSSEPGISNSTLNQPGREHQAARFVEWPNSDLQKATNKMMLTRWLYEFSSLFEDDYNHPRHHSEEEFAVDMFLQAALSTNIMSRFSELSVESWVDSSQGKLFLMASAQALSILKTWKLESPAFIDTRRPEIEQLGLRLTELLRHDLFACLPRTGTPVDVDDLATRYFPWHGCLERFVDYPPADSELGALLRYLVQEVSDKSRLSDLQLDTLAALFPLNSEADYNLQVAISQHLAERNDPAQAW